MARAPSLSAAPAGKLLCEVTTASRICFGGGVLIRTCITVSRRRLMVLRTDDGATLMTIRRRRFAIVGLGFDMVRKDVIYILYSNGFIDMQSI